MATEPMTVERLEELLRLDAATCRVYRSASRYEVSTGIHDGQPAADVFDKMQPGRVVATFRLDNCVANARAFITFRDAVPELIAAIKRLQAANRELIQRIEELENADIADIGNVGEVVQG